MNTPEKDCIHRGWIAALALIAVLTAVSFIPPQSLGGVKLRRANILSDLVAFDDAVAAAEEPALFDEEDFHVDMEQVAERIEAERIEADSAPRPVQITFEWTLAPDRRPAHAGLSPTAPRLNRTLVEIAGLRAQPDFGGPSAGSFYDPRCSAPGVRCASAVLGDSVHRYRATIPHGRPGVKGRQPRLTAAEARACPRPPPSDAMASPLTGVPAPHDQNPPVEKAGTTPQHPCSAPRPAGAPPA